ncbi:MAG: DUF4384 domain-containing protein [Desulfobacterales bacterium]
MPWFRRFKRALPGPFTFLLIVGSAASLQAQASPSGLNTLNFLFGAGVQLSKSSDAKPVPLETHSVLASGDRIKFFLAPQSDANFYLFHEGADGRVALLYPADIDESRLAAGRLVYVPKGSLWFELDAASGAEKFLFLASHERLARLEDLAARHAADKERGGPASSAKELLDEISRLNKSYRSLAAPAEMPVRIAGKFRAPPKADSTPLPDITPFAKEITAKDFYSKTFTIDHR